MIRLTVLYSVAVAIACAQSAAEPKSFDVATVKQAGESSGNGLRLDRCSGGPGASDPSLYTCRVLPLKTLIEIAYGLPSASISAPAWMEAERYDIVAKPPAGATAAQMPAMLQSLLEERFALRVDRETKAHSVYALVAPHGAGKLKPSSDQPEDPAEAQARGRAAGERRRALGPGVP